MSDSFPSYSQPHDEDCGVLESVRKDDWNTPWTVVEMETEWLDDRAIEYEDGYIEELVAVFHCNNPDCEGRIAVPANKILEQLPDTIEDEKR